MRKLDIYQLTLNIFIEIYDLFFLSSFSFFFFFSFFLFFLLLLLSLIIIGKRSKECPGCGELVTQSDKVCLNCDYAFSNKSLTNSQFMIAAAEESLSIRDQFAFEPVREEDGSLLIQAVLGRKLRKEEKVKGGYKSRW